MSQTSLKRAWRAPCVTRTSIQVGIHPQPCRYFHQSWVQRFDDHYRELGLQPNATLSEIKKAFYSLSKKHHPDRNPKDQAAASQKFAAISDAYHILGDAKQREKYDRDVQAHGGTAKQPSGAPSGSGFSAGGRRASGLSKRKGAFRGPPPSFYRAGGWGQNAGKREANMGADAREQPDSDANARSMYGEQQQQYDPSRDSTGSWPFMTDMNDVSHFDRDRHYKSQMTVEEQLAKGRKKRRSIVTPAEKTSDVDVGGNSMFQFFQICGLLAVGLGVPFVFLSHGS